MQYMPRKQMKSYELIPVLCGLTQTLELPYKREDNIKIDRRETGSEDMKWMNL
jgi:hypothetical protein